MKLDLTDLKILEIMQERGRITNAQLATEIGLSPAPTLERVRKLESGGFIQSFHALVDAAKLGLNVAVFVEVKLDYNSGVTIESFMKEMEGIPEIMEAYLITGGGDFLLKLYALSINDFQQFLISRLSKVKGISNMESKVVLSTMKRKMKLPLSPVMMSGHNGYSVG